MTATPAPRHHRSSGRAAAPGGGLERLGAWVAARAKELETVAQVRAADAPVADRALEIVRAFVVERGLILYGGQAIDYALRLKGARIYPDHQTPDYDFLSPNSVTDAYDLADRLHAAGFDAVGAIRAIHVQTMRVKTDFIFVADVSYAPPAVFERLPTVSYAGLRVLHPDYQRADIHLAFCFPFNDPPREDIFHRFKKDLGRFNLLEEHYPITSGGALAAPPVVAAGGGRSAAAEIDPSRVALHGFAAYGLLRAALDELLAAAAEAGVGAPPPAGAPPLGVVVTPGAGEGGPVRVEFTPPACEGVAPGLVVATPWPHEVVPALAAAGGGAPRPVAWFAPYMDSRPATAVVSPGGGEAPVIVFSTRNRLLAVSALRAGGEGGVPVLVVSPQYLLLHFLYEAHAAAPGPGRDLYADFYRATLEVLRAADGVIGRLHAEGGGPEVPAGTFRRFVESSPFGLSVRTLGDANHNAAYLIRLGQSARAVGDRPPGVDPADLPEEEGLPANYYPKEGRKAPPAFDYAQNAVFLRAGEPVPPPQRPGPGRRPPDGEETRD